MQVDGEITSKLVTFKSREVAPLIADELGSYYTKSEVDNKVGGDLGGYYTKAQADGEFTSESELSSALAAYATEAKITGTILTPYIKSAGMSVGGVEE